MERDNIDGNGVLRGSSRFHVRLDTTPRAAGDLRSPLRGWLDAVCTSDEEAFDVVLACYEACANAVSSPSGGAATAVIEVDAAVDVRGVLTVVVRDYAHVRPERNLQETRVFLRLMESLVDSAETYARADGVTLVLRRRLGRSESWAAAASQPRPTRS
jgi:anti-sigma regulatory factor (Ser/Thr protein kinase)